MERLKFFNLFLLFMFLFIRVQSQDQSPLNVIKQSNQKVLNIFKAQKTIDKKTKAKLLEIINEVTDFEAISHQVIERFCKKLTQSQCETFDALFQQLLRVSSLKKLGRYRADRFDYLEEEIKNKDAIVRTIAYFKDENATLDYHLQLKNNHWVIVNYVMEDVDTIRNYKKQFLRLFARKSFEEVMDRLKKRISDYQ